MYGINNLKEEEINYILEEFDMTEPRLQRRVVVTVVLNQYKSITLLQAVLEQGVVPHVLQTKIKEFLEKDGV